MNEEMYGDGYIDFIASKLGNVLKNRNLLLQLRNPELDPPSVRKFMSMHRNDPIHSLQVMRRPIQSTVKKMLNFISLGSLQRATDELNYDDLFHLGLIVNGKYILDKRDVIHAEPYRKTPQDEIMDIYLNPNAITIGEFWDNTRNYMGDVNFTSYNPANNNCQVFVSSMLKANGLMTSELNKFINQDAIKIFEKMPSFVDKFAGFVSGKLAPSFNLLMEGEGVPKKKYPRDALLDIVKQSNPDYFDDDM